MTAVTSATKIVSTQQPAHTDMRHIFLLGLLALTAASPSPQYSGEVQDLSDSQLDALKDIFGNSANNVYNGNNQDSGTSERQVADFDDGTNGVEVIVQVVKNEDGYVAPDDYQTQGALTDKATTTVDNVFENCADYTASQGYECVPYYQCHNGSIITDGGGLIDIRNGFGILSPEDSKCEGFLDVCCQDPDFVAPPPVPVVKHVPRCGQRHQNGLGVRIQGFNQHESQFGEWPHMCAVLAEEPLTEGEPGYTGESQTVNLYQCGGSLIAPGTILTAAHCVDKFRHQPHKLKIRCGEWDTQNQTEPRPHQDRYVSNLDIHPEFDPKNLASDYALLFTEQPFQLQEHIDTICLPDPEEIFDGQTCFATGWGKDQFGAAGQYQVVLKEVDLPVVGHDHCEAALRNSRLGRRFKLDDSFLCAGGVGSKDTCKGDGGSPLVCASKYDPFTYVQAGIVAWGIGCGENNLPGVYADVAKAVCWIDYAMTCYYGQTSGDSSSYWGYSAQQCQTWMDTEISSLNARIAAKESADSLTGRRRAQAIGSGLKAEAVVQRYNQCSVYWAPGSTEPLTDGGYGSVDLSDFGRTVAVTEDSSAVKLTEASQTY